MAVKPRYDLKVFDISATGYELLAKLKFTTFLPDGTRTITCKGGGNLHTAISKMVEDGHLKVEVLRQFNYPGELKGEGTPVVVKKCKCCGRDY